jgi:hypothetical protein
MPLSHILYSRALLRPVFYKTLRIIPRTHIQTSVVHELREPDRMAAGVTLTARLQELNQWLIKHSDVQCSNNARLVARVPLDVGVAVARLTRD